MLVGLRGTKRRLFLGDDIPPKPLEHEAQTFNLVKRAGYSTGEPRHVREQ
jgi:hypothetical protein